MCQFLQQLTRILIEWLQSIIAEKPEVGIQQALCSLEWVWCLWEIARQPLGFFAKNLILGGMNADFPDALQLSANLRAVCTTL